MALEALDVVYPPEIWARESLMILSKNLVAANLVHRDFQNEIAQYGDLIRTRRPDKLTIADKSTTGLAGNNAMDTASPQATQVTIPLNKHKVVSFGISQRDQDTSIKSLIEEFMEPAMVPLAEEVDGDLLGAAGLALPTRADNTPSGAAANIVETITANEASPATAGGGTTPDLGLADFAKIQEKLMLLEFPMVSPAGVPNISMVCSPEHYSKVLQVPELVRADATGDATGAIKTGYVGQIFGMAIYASQNVPAATGDGTSPGDNAVSGELKQSLVFHKNALAFVTRGLEAVNSEFGVRSATVERDGVGMRVMMSYSHTEMRWIVSLDILYGFAHLNDDLRIIFRDQDVD